MKGSQDKKLLLEDIILVKQCIKGDETNFKLIVEKYQA